ncbi:MAG: UTP--glucose-1-phosphate uridylyltransferase, partial [Myxococcales bacterium]|nr:UTP--glucose-1-phosphate uridylyltransferase [Myxococcales bacterium]
LTGEVSRVDDAEVKRVPDDPAEAERLRERGAQALAAGELAICVLAGGMATRMGGVVKSLLPVVGEHTFLDYRLAERAQLGERHGKAPPFWLMTSESTDAPIAAAVAARADADGIATFEQLVSLRLDEAGGLFRDDEGEPSVYATGHGDLPDALRRAGLLQAFVAAGGRHVWISNVDNLGASVDLAILGQHIEEGRSLTVELVDKVAGDKGGGPVRHQGQPIIAEHFRLPRDFDADAIPIFNTNTFLVDARALLELTLEWTYVEVVKQVGERRAVQFERLLGEITIAIRPTFNWVPRDGEGSRFLPVKSYEDLEHHRPALERIGRRLGLLRPSSG